MRNTLARRARDWARRRREFGSAVPARSFAVLLAAVFCLFSTLGFTSDIVVLGRLSPWSLATAAVLSGLTAVAWVLTISRSIRFLPLGVGLQALTTYSARSNVLLALESIDEAGLAQIRHRLQLDTILLSTGVMLGYGLFIAFIAGQGRRYMRVRTEITLAAEIHQLLVPPIDERVGGFQFFGRSLPSGEVGGDLVDFVGSDGAWVAYLADVSGHGVASGTLMGMFKSALRGRLAAGASLDAVLADVNRVMMGLKKPGMFVTGAFVASEAPGTLRFTLAGHPPILHFRAATRTVEELVSPNLPIAMFDEQIYRSAAVRVEAGDVLALVSDGLMEVFNGRDEDFGLEGLKAALARLCGRPLQEVSDALYTEVRQHGVQIDDQSLLLIGRLP